MYTHTYLIFICVCFISSFIHLIHSFVRSFVRWLVGWFVCLFACLVGWLVGCLFVCLFVCLFGSMILALQQPRVSRDLWNCSCRAKKIRASRFSSPTTYPHQPYRCGRRRWRLRQKSREELKLIKNVCSLNSYSSSDQLHNPALLQWFYNLPGIPLFIQDTGWRTKSDVTFDAIAEVNAGSLRSDR